jgi:sialate O-acetylesterase
LVRFGATAAIALACAAVLRAEVQLERLFTDRVVLQRGQPVPIWGRADAGEKVAVEFAGQRKETTTGATGRWSVTLDPLAASRESRTLVVRGRNTIEVKDVLVGEVWLLSGQSNMAFLMEAMARPAEREPEWPARARRDMAAAADPLLREFRVDNRAALRPRDDVPTRVGWMTWTPQQAGAWAAMAAYFGQRLRTSLEVPVGIVMCAWGGSSCAAWISAETLRGPELNSLWPEEISGATMNLANAHLYNGMLRPVAPYAIAGFAWYQGETEAVPAFNPYLHRFLLQAMIQDWRRLWSRPELPFYVVQLPNRENEPRWTIVRESQAAALALPGTRMITTIDLGQAWDLHPRNKPVVADRLADLVLDREYGRKSWPGEATFAGASREPGALRISFRGAEAGLKTRDGQPPAEFEVAGEDRVFHPAQARIEGATVRVSAAPVANPVAVRYAWRSAPRVNLVHRGGIPVAPFRSDDWPVDGQEALAQPLPPKATLAATATGASLVKGEAANWQACAEIAELGKHRDMILTTRGATGAILVRGFPVREGVPASPALYWTAEPSLDAAKGFTLEVAAHPTRTGHADRGLDLEACLPRPDGTYRRYLLSAFPMKLQTYRNNLAPRTSHATQTLLLRTDLDADAAVYRLAVRPDGIAQVYLNGEVVGTTPGESLSGPAPARPYLRIGKTVTQGEWNASLKHAAFDVTGAFAPSAGTRKQEAAPSAAR